MTKKAEHCSFCGREKRSKGTILHPKVALVVNEQNGKAICNHCLAKSLALLNDPSHEGEAVINITDLIGPDGPTVPSAA